MVGAVGESVQICLEDSSGGLAGSGEEEGMSERRLLETDGAFWRVICPNLHICDEEYQRAALVEVATEPVGEVGGGGDGASARLQEEGFFWWRDALGGDVVARLKEAALALEKAKFPPTLLLLFDETWTVVEKITRLLKGIEGTGLQKNRFNGDILAWLIDPSQGHAGFSPHRDRQPDDVASSFHADGSPKYLTCWLALSDATPDNSCLYVIPRHADPGYLDGDVDDEDPLQRALKSKEDYQNIRALPLHAGSAAIFTHRIIHWGSRGRAGVAPRMSLSFAFSSADYEPPYFPLDGQLPFPHLELRLSLACAQMIAYHDRFRSDMSALSDYHAVFRANAHLLDETFRKRVWKEFVSAVKQVGEDKAPEPLVEAMMEAMLEAADDMEDDFDDAVEDGGQGPADAAEEDHDEDDDDDDDDGDDDDEDDGLTSALGDPRASKRTKHGS